MTRQHHCAARYCGCSPFFTFPCPFSLPRALWEFSIDRKSKAHRDPVVPRQLQVFTHCTSYYKTIKRTPCLHFRGVIDSSYTWGCHLRDFMWNNGARLWKWDKALFQAGMGATLYRMLRQKRQWALSLGEQSSQAQPTFEFKHYTSTLITQLVKNVAMSQINAESLWLNTCKSSWASNISNLASLACAVTKKKTRKLPRNIPNMLPQNNHVKKEQQLLSEKIKSL